MNDLLLGVGLPILQICARECAYLVTCQLVVYKDAIQTSLLNRIVTIFMRILALTLLLWSPGQASSSSMPGPWLSVVYPPSIVVSVLALHRSYPVSLVTVTTVLTFYKRHCQFKEITSSNPSLSRSRYIRLMIISSTEMFLTIPLGTYYIVYNAKSGVTPYTGWTDIHSHYSSVLQIAAFIWKNDSAAVTGLELYRWSLIFCSFIFFAFFGFADEARQHYRRVYTTLASRIGYSTFTLQGSSHAYVVYLLRSVRRGSLGLIVIFVLQYIVSPLREEQGRHCLCSHNGRPDRQAEVQPLICRPTFDCTIYCPHHRLQERSQDRGVFTFEQHGICLCGELY